VYRGLSRAAACNADSQTSEASALEASSYRLSDFDKCKNYRTAWEVACRQGELTQHTEREKRMNDRRRRCIKWENIK